MIDYKKKALEELLKEKIFYSINNIDENILIELSNLFVNREYSHNEMLVKAGDKWDKVFFIHKGIIRLFYTNLEGQDYNKGFFWENQLLWPIAPSARKNNSLFNVSALETVTVSVCNFSSFYSWLTRHGYWEKFALPYVELFVEDKFRREYEFLTNSATERFRHFCTEYSDLVGRIPDYHLASYLGVTNVTLSRIKKSIDFNLC
ncbi:Crp/Fnr family transcriptional regulator [Desulfosporosinus sp. FKA]|uniref:Crp/Fnr family transcriptional regulator n=1 Tax=Desulfosporosinus sp. FKA TaxID=1969834 RepID=UPI000B49BAA6|nr:Crp/Fnr family transcriptional regulator [Desulfosporosinus sp. FKA]